jgi:polyphenol oxidase
MFVYNKKIKTIRSDIITLKTGFTTKQLGQNNNLPDQKIIFKKIFNDIYKEITFCTPLQTHSKNVGFIGKKHIKSKFTVYKNRDALIYKKNQKKILCLYLKTADCVPVLMTDVKNQIIGVIHSGWRGTLKNITNSAVNRMLKIGANVKDIKVIIGPAIDACCYKIHNDRLEKFKNIYRNTIENFPMNNNFGLSLRKVVEYQLINSGIKHENIDISKHCTKCHKELYYSYRRNKTEERILSFICI